MDIEQLKADLAGCYVTIPTPFADTPDLPINEPALRTYARFLIDSGLDTRYATLLAGGAAGAKSGLKIKPADRTVDIEQLTGDIETVNEPAGHRARIDFLQRHPAGGHLGFGKPRRGFDRDR